MTTDYSGTDNLEVMSEAVNYNEFLVKQAVSLAKSGDRILDFGAGIGTFAKRLADGGHDVICLEPDVAQAERLRTEGLAVYQEIEEIEHESLDYVYTLNVLEHIENDHGAMAAIASKLKKGGRLFVYVPAFAVLYSSMDRKVGHVRRYTRRDLSTLVSEAGFVDVVARYVDSIGFFAALAYKQFGSDQGDINMNMLKLYDRCVFPMSRLADGMFGRMFGKNVLLTARKG